LENYGGGILEISIDIANYELEKNEQLLIDNKLWKIITGEQWNKIMKESEEKVCEKKINSKKQNKKLKKY